jgi:hypothetical protein
MTNIAIMEPQIRNKDEISKIHASQLLSHEKTLKKMMSEFGTFLEAVDILSDTLKMTEPEKISMDSIESYKASRDHLQDYIECIDLTYKDIGDCLIHIYGNFSDEYKNYRLCEKSIEALA